MTGRHCGCVALLAVLLAATLAATSAEIKLQQVDRKVSLLSQFARIAETIKAKNTGSSPEEAVVLCELLQPGALLAYYKVLNGKEELKAELTAVPGAPAGATCHSVKLAAPLPASETVSLTLTAVAVKAQTAFPVEITQQESQLMVYLDNVYVVSPYAVSSQTTEVIAAGSIKSFTDSEKPSSKPDSNKLKLGKYDLIKPWTVAPLRVHFENNKPFKQVLTYVKEIEVSHWGNIYVEEGYEVKNTGARHTGAFSRLKYAHTYNGKANSFRDMRAVLPASAHHTYYVDLIGNISTSNVRRGLSQTTIDFELRYPLMGGWKVDFTLGYSVPLAGFLFRKPDGKRRLVMDLATPLDDVYVEDTVIRVVLPEGAHSIVAELPYAMEQSMTKKFTYLDTSGRPVLVLHKTHMVPEHQAAKLVVDYAFAPASMLHEPLLLIAFYAALLLAVIAYNRMETTISRDDKWVEARAREVLATYMEQIQAAIEDQLQLLGGLAKDSEGLRDASGVDAAARRRAGADKQLRDIDDKIKALVVTVESRSARVAGQVREVLAKLAGLRERQAKLAAERVELLKKQGSAAPGMAELQRRLAPGVAAYADAKRELEGAIEAVFGAY